MFTTRNGTGLSNVSRSRSPIIVLDQTQQFDGVKNFIPKLYLNSSFDLLSSEKQQNETSNLNSTCNYDDSSQVSYV